MIMLDYNDKRPLYEQIIHRFQTLILNGVLEPDAQLPSVRSLAIELSINANTIQKAYSELERGGFIYSVKGRGNFVRGDESLVKQQHEKTLKQLTQQLKYCKDIGITKQDLQNCLNAIFMEVKP